MKSQKVLPFPSISAQTRQDYKIENDLNYQYSEFTGEVQVEVSQSYDADRSDPEQNQYFYLYQVRITNHGSSNIELQDRRWKVRGDDGKRYEVHNRWSRGSIKLGPGESFDHSGFCPLHSPTGNMRGRILTINEIGEESWVNVPVFFFRRN